MSYEEESSESQESTPTPEEVSSQETSAGAEQQAAAPEKQVDEEPQVPFHKHPRFQEIIDQNRSYKSELDQTRGYVEAMQRELQALKHVRTEPKPNEPKYKPLMEQLKAINPEFAQFQEELMSNLESVKEKAALADKLQQRLDAREQQDFQSQASSKLSSLYESNKIPESLRKRYDREVRALAYEEEIQGKKLSLKDVDRLFKSVHDEYTPFIESLKRESLKGYVKDKKSDVSPIAATGGASVAGGAKKIPSMDSQDGFEQTKKWLATELRAAKKQI